MAHPVADIFIQAAVLNRSDTRRSGSVLNLDSGTEVIVSGDLHGNRNNLQKILSHAHLGQRPNCRLVIQEVVHGPLDPINGQDRSIELLLRVARLKIAHPQQVLFVLGNHDIAQITGNEISKEGRGVCKTFTAGVQSAFGDDAAEVMQAVHEFLRSLPLAVRCPNGVFISHSLPSPNRMEIAGADILDRPFTDDDFRRGKSVYEWTWGRGQTAEQLEQMARTLGVEYFILGHRHAEVGYEIISPRGISITSDHDRGYIVQFLADEPFGGADIDKALMLIGKIE